MKKLKITVILILVVVLCSACIAKTVSAVSEKIFYEDIFHYGPINTIGYRIIDSQLNNACYIVKDSIHCIKLDNE